MSERPANGASTSRGRRTSLTAFVLGGGGNLGAVQVGMVRALLHRGVHPDMVLGCSVGALNGAAIAGNPTVAGAERLAETWRTLRSDSLFPTAGLGSVMGLLRRGRYALGKNDGLRRLIEEVASFTTFEEATVPLHVVATSLATGAERWFHSGPILEPILASAALPAVFPPVEIDGELHVDGAVVDNVPIARAVELGAERIYVCHVGNFQRARPQPKRPIDVLLQSFSIARNHRFSSEAARGWTGVELVVLPAVDPGTIGRADFRRTSELIDLGFERALTGLIDTPAPAVG